MNSAADKTCNWCVTEYHEYCGTVDTSGKVIACVCICPPEWDSEDEITDAQYEEVLAFIRKHNDALYITDIELIEHEGQKVIEIVTMVEMEFLPTPMHLPPVPILGTILG